MHGGHGAGLGGCAILHVDVLERLTGGEQIGEDPLDGGLEGAGGEMEDADVLDVGAVSAPRLEGAVGGPEGRRGEELVAVAVEGEGAGLADQRPDDVPVVDAGAAVLAHARQALDEGALVEDLDGVGVLPSLDPLADEAGGDGVDAARDADGAPPPDDRLEGGVRGHGVWRKRQQMAALLLDPVGGTLIECGDLLADEGEPGGLAVEVAAAAELEGLLEASLQQIVALLDDAILIGLARLDAGGLDAVVVEDAGVAGIERASAGLLELVGGRGEIVGACDLGGAAELPHAMLEAIDQGLEGLGECDLREGPAAEGEAELEEQVDEGHAADRHAEAGRVGEVHGAEPAGLVRLLEEDLLGRAMQGSPVPEPPLEGTELPVLELVGAGALQVLQDGLGLELALPIGLEQRHDLRLPDLGEGVLARTPVPWSLRLRGERARLPLAGAADAHARRCRRRFLRLAFHALLPQQPDLPVCDHGALRWRDQRRMGRQDGWEPADLIVADRQK